MEGTLGKPPLRDDENSSIISFRNTYGLKTCINHLFFSAMGCTLYFIGMIRSMLTSVTVLVTYSFIIQIGLHCLSFSQRWLLWRTFAIILPNDGHNGIKRCNFWSKSAGRPQHPYQELALIFENGSTRKRCGNSCSNNSLNIK